MARHMHKNVTSLGSMAFSKGPLEEEYAMWAEEHIMGRTKKQGPVPRPSRKEVAN